MPSPSSGNLNSVTSADADRAAGGGAVAVLCVLWGTSGATFGTDGAGAAFAGEGARATLAVPLSTVKITWPTEIFSPTLTRTSFITPLTDEGTSTTALTVCSSITAWPSEIVAPGEIISRTKSP